MTDTVVQPGAAPAPPATPAEARQRIDALIADKEFGAKLLAGDAATNKEFGGLQLKADSVDPADQVAAAMRGDIGDLPDSSTKEMAAAAGMLREIGVRESIIEETLRGHEVTQQEYDLTAAWKARQMKDPVFVKAYLSGDADARHKMTLAAIVLSGGIKGARSSF
jgi:hypothetical protein